MTIGEFSAGIRVLVFPHVVVSSILSLPNSKRKLWKKTELTFSWWEVGGGSEYGAQHTSRICVTSSLTISDGISTPPLVVACKNFARIGTHSWSMAKSAWLAESNMFICADKNWCIISKTCRFSRVWKIPHAGLHRASSEKKTGDIVVEISYHIPS